MMMFAIPTVFHIPSLLWRCRPGGVQTREKQRKDDATLELQRARLDVVGDL